MEQPLCLFYMTLHDYPDLAGGLSLTCARLMDGCLTTTVSAISQPTRPTQPAIPPGSVK